MHKIEPLTTRTTLTYAGFYGFVSVHGWMRNLGGWFAAVFLIDLLPA